MKIAVEFDGTIVKDCYPAIGEELPLASFTLINLIEKGHQILLYTHRTGEELEAAIAWCLENGIQLWGVNGDLPEGGLSKCIIVEADLFIHSKNFGGVPHWSHVFKTLHPDEADFIKLRYIYHNVKRKLKRLS